MWSGYMSMSERMPSPVPMDMCEYIRSMSSWSVSLSALMTLVSVSL